MPKPNLRVVRRPVEELSDEQIARLMDFGRQEAALLDQMEEAVRTGDKNLCWEIAQALVHIQDEAGRVTEAKEK